LACYQYTIKNQGATYYYDLYSTSYYERLENTPHTGVSIFLAAATDRTYQIWERNPLSVELRSNDVLFQKLHYIHQNPVRAGICSLPEAYRFSSASVYAGNGSEWDFLEKWE
jgi:hypothetical protein